MALPTSGALSIQATANCCNVIRSIAYCVDGNTTGTKRLCTLSVSAGKSAPHCMREFYGYSPGGSQSISLSSTAVTFPSNGGTCLVQVTATAGVSWSVSDNMSWLSNSPTSGSGNGTFTMTAGGNIGSTRGGVVTVSSAAGNPTINITQLSTIG